MARVRKLDRNRDGHAVIALAGDKRYGQAELHVVGGSCPYLTARVQDGEVFAAFSGKKALRKLARALLEVTK